MSQNEVVERFESRDAEGLKVGGSQAAMIDAAIIPSAARPHTEVVEMMSRITLLHTRTE